MGERREGEKSREREKQKRRKGRSGENGVRQKLPLVGEKEKEETQAASRKEDLPASVDRGGEWAWLVS